MTQTYFDEAAVEAWMAANVTGFRGPMRVEKLREMFMMRRSRSASSFYFLKDNAKNTKKNIPDPQA